MQKFFAGCSLVISVVLLPLGMTRAFAAGATLTPTTTLAAETANNTSAANTFASQSNGNLGASNISKVPMRSLLYAGSTTKLYAHLMPWFGGTNHMNVGYKSDDPVQVKRQVNDMMSRGLQGTIIDWYGPNHTRENNASLYLKAEAETHGGAFEFAIMEDGGALGSCGTLCTDKLISDLAYIYTTYEPSPAYMRWSGRPVIFFFGVDLVGTIDWLRVRNSVSGNPIFIFRNSSGFTHAQTNGAYGWVGISSNATDMGLSTLDGFYSTALKYPSAYGYGSNYKGFNDTLASWGKNRIVNQQCGQTWLSTTAELNKYYSASNQLEALQLVTWNDYEEGSEIESGVDSCVSLNASVSGGTLNWSVSGQESTIDHYTVFISADGVNLMPLADLTTGNYSINLNSFGFAAGTYKVWVKALGKPSLTNKISPAATYTVTLPVNQPPVASLSLTPTQAYYPTTVSASSVASSDPDGTVVASKLDFGDGTVVSGFTASHAYAAPGTYNVRTTVTDSSGATASTSKSVTVNPASVTISSPLANSTVTTTVHVVAKANNGNAIKLMQVYVDGVKKYEVAAAAVDQYVKVAAGTRRITVQSIDVKNNVSKTVENVTAK